jgi:dolichol-phosphate mannosyltransferase
MRDLVLIPTWNEAENIVPLIRELQRHCPQAHILVLDDRSEDGTAELVRKSFGHETRVEVVLRSGERGLGRTYRDGYALALARGFDRVCQLDADFSHAPTDVPRLFAALDAADLAIGSRYVPGGGSEHWPWYRLFVSRWGGWFGSLISGLPVRDISGGFLAFTAEALRRIDPARLRSDDFSIQFESRCRAKAEGLRMVEVPIVFRDRVRGYSKMNFARELWASLKVAFRYRFVSRR